MKKLNKFFAVLVALAMMATLCVSMAFAADGDVPTGTKDNAVLNKYLVVPEGASVPEVTNVFKFTTYEAGLSGVTKAEADAAKPADVTIVIPANSTQTTADPEDGNSVYGWEAINLPTNLQHPGVYAYLVKEDSSTITGKTDAQTIVPDGAEYIIRFTVVNGENGPEVKDITAQEATEDEDGNVTPGEKKDPTIKDPTGKTEDDDDDPTTPDKFVAATDDGVSFKNTYQKTEGDGTLANAPLKISKVVTGTDKPATSETFPFTLYLTKALGAEDTALTAKVYEGTEVVKTYDNLGYATAGNAIELKDGQVLAFDTMPAGTKWAVIETLNNADKFSAYQPKVDVTNNANAIPQKTAQLGQSLAAQDEGASYLLNEGKKDVAAYTNAYDKNIDTPTGILISNLPYIALALVAIGGLVAYVVVRRRDEDNA